MEYYSAIKEKKILPFMIVWMDLDNIMLNEVSQSKKYKYHMISLILESSEQTKLTKDIGRDS